MTTITTIGRITKDFKLMKSEGGCVYANFNLAVNEGVGENKKTMYFECTVFGTDAERLIKAKAKKGSLIHVTGKFGVSEFTRKNGEFGYSLKLTVLSWSYIPVSNGQNNANGNNSNSVNNDSAPVPNHNPEQHHPEGDYNGVTDLDDDDFPPQ